MGQAWWFFFLTGIVTNYPPAICHRGIDLEFCTPNHKILIITIVPETRHLTPLLSWHLVWNFMKSDAIFQKYLTAEHAEIAEIIFIFFLSVLCELRGELLVSFSIRPAVFSPAAGLKPDTSYETTLKANRRTAEYRISNVEGWFRFAQSFDYKIDRIHYSMLDVGCSMFDVH